MARICQIIRRSRAFMRSKPSQLTRAPSCTLVKQGQLLEETRLWLGRSQNRARLKSSSPIMWHWISAQTANPRKMLLRQFQIWSVSPNLMWSTMMLGSWSKILSTGTTWGRWVNSRISSRTRMIQSWNSIPRSTKLSKWARRMMPTSQIPSKR